MRIAKILSVIGILSVMMISKVYGIPVTACLVNPDGHVYLDATCTEPKTCACGLTLGKALGHSYETVDKNTVQHKLKCIRCDSTKWEDHTGGTATCTTKAKCSVSGCGKSYGNALGHIKGEHIDEGKCGRQGCDITVHSMDTVRGAIKKDITYHYFKCIGCDFEYSVSHAEGTHDNNGVCSTNGCKQQYETHGQGTNITSKDGTYHYYNCIFPGCIGKYGEGHTGGTHPEGKCSVCDYMYEEHRIDHENPSFATPDETYHYYLCFVCRVNDLSKCFKDEHSVSVIGRESTSNIHRISCQDCSYKLGEHTAVWGEAELIGITHLTVEDLEAITGEPASVTVEINSRERCTVEYCNFVRDHPGATIRTCTTPSTCTGCGIEILPALGHIYTGAYISNETNHWKKCPRKVNGSTCNAELSRGVHTGGTHNNYGVCTTCDRQYQNHFVSTTVKNKDNINHYFECTYTNCTSTFVAPHEWTYSQTEHKKICRISACGKEIAHTESWGYQSEKEHKCKVDGCIVTEEHIANYEQIPDNLTEHKIICEKCVIPDMRENHEDVNNDYICDKCNMILYKLSYDIEKATNKDVTATLKVWKDREYKHVFNENGTYIFEIINPNKNVMAEVTWIYKDIKARIEYTTNKERDEVTAKIVFEQVRFPEGKEPREGETEQKVTITNNNGQDTYLFITNGIFIFEIEDNLGNKEKIPAEVTWLKNGRLSVNNSHTVFETGYIFADIELEPKMRWKVNESMINTIDIDITEIKADGTREKVEKSKISKLPILIKEEKTGESTADFERTFEPGKYRIQLAIGGAEVFLDITSKYEVRAEGMKLKNENGGFIKLRGNKMNYFMIDVIELRDLT